jgi:hypothetical protein
MKQRTLGILGGALLVGGVIVAIGSGIAANRFAPANDGAAIHRPDVGQFPRHRGQGQPGPFFGDPRRRGGLPAPGRQAPNVSPKPTG